MTDLSAGALGWRCVERALGVDSRMLTNAMLRFLALPFSRLWAMY
jgi:hypothetical protein